MAAALTALMAAGCTDELSTEYIDGRVVSVPKGQITFLAQMDKPAGEADTRSFGHLDVEEQEWALTADGASTRADAHDEEGALYSYFANAGVRIFLYGAPDDDREESEIWADPHGVFGQYPTEAQLTYSKAVPATFNEEGLLSPFSSILWTQAKNPSTGNYFKHLRAYAFAPYIDDERNGGNSIHSMVLGGQATFNPGGTNSIPSITYTVPDDPTEQVDLIAGYSGIIDGDYGMQDGSTGTVPVTFHHVLSAVQFKVEFTRSIRVEALTLSGVYKKGTGYIDDQGNQVVTPIKDVDNDEVEDEMDGDLYSHTFTFNGSGNGYTEFPLSDDKAGGTLTEGDQTLMMVPQTLPATAYVTLTYKVSENGGASWSNTKTLSCPLQGNLWKPGYRYIYTIKEEETNYIYFDLAAGDITINGNTYKGFVYKNTASTAEIATITGSHSASNKYYVYQSVPQGTTGFDSSRGYNKGWTGDVDATGVKTDAGSTIDLPDYPTVMSPDGTMTWADYITGDSAAYRISCEWENVANTAKRVGSANKISVGTASTIILDDIWGTNETIGSTDSRCYNFSSATTIILKGDNKLPRVYTGSTSPLTFTSYYGDASSKGSLTVLKKGGMPWTNRGNTAIGGYNTTTRLNFNGGTIYAANPTEFWDDDTINENEKKNNGVIGGSNNFEGDVTITGGRVTAVGHCTSATIGGGGGSESMGNNGHVTISGSAKVYAYQFGTFSSKITQYGGSVQDVGVALPATAIGGGSSWRNDANNGYVTISGNAYVFAYSVGGVAIGGGSSYACKGGNGEVTISENATVVAMSVSGTIYGRRAGHLSVNVSAGTSIGGGNGGDWTFRRTDIGDSNTNSYGGDAVITINNGNVETGSMGGGKAGTNYDNVKKGFAKVYVYNGNVQGQAIMAKGGSEDCVFQMQGGKMTLSDDSFEFVEPNGGAVWMDSGNCTITGGTISGFKALNGGAVYMEGGTFTMTGGTIENCRAQYDSGSGTGGNGGAIYINDDTGTATVNISGSAQIKNNYADLNGGGIYLQGGNVSVAGGSVSGNKALATGSDDKGNGGGIYLLKGNFTQSGGSVSGNNANRNGGGIWVSSPDGDINVTISGGSITGNSSERYGAGLYVEPGSEHTATIDVGEGGTPYSNSNPDISGNSASRGGGGIYATGSGATLNLHDGKVYDNYVSAYTYNESITNEGGMVTMDLYPADYATEELRDTPVPYLDYITVTIDPAGGDFDAGETAGAPQKRYLVKSTNSKLRFEQPKRMNFTFTGWLPSQGEADTNHPATDYNGGTTGDGVTFNYDKDITLTAQWRLNN